MNRPAIRTIFALLLALTLPLLGLAFAVQNAATPGHFHPSALAEGVGHGHVHDHHTDHADAHGLAAPHAHALDDDDVVYVIGDHDPQSPTAFKLPSLDGVARAALPVPVAAPREAVRVAAASTGPLRSRSVAPLLRPPRLV